MSLKIFEKNYHKILKMKLKITGENYPMNLISLERIIKINGKSNYSGEIIYWREK